MRGGKYGEKNTTAHWMRQRMAEAQQMRSVHRPVTETARIHRVCLLTPSIFGNALFLERARTFRAKRHTRGRRGGGLDETAPQAALRNNGVEYTRKEKKRGAPTPFRHTALVVSLRGRYQCHHPAALAATLDSARVGQVRSPSVRYGAAICIEVLTEMKMKKIREERKKKNR